MAGTSLIPYNINMASPRGTRLDTFYYTISTNPGPAIAGAAAAQGAFAALAASMAARTGGILAVLAGLIVLTVKVGKAMSKMAAEIDFGTRKVATLLPQTAEDLKGVRNAIVDLSTRVPQTPQQLNAALYQAVSAGARDVAEALLLVEVAAKAAVAGQGEIETTMKSLLTVLNAFQLPLSEAQDVADIFFRTIERGVITLPEMEKTIGKVAATAAVAGIPMEEIGAAVATLTKNGLNAAETMTSLTRFLFLTVNNSDKAKKASADLGFEFSATALRTKGLAGFMQELNEKAGANIETLAKVNPNIRAFRAAAILAGTGLEEFLEILEVVKDRTGATADAYDDMAGSAQILAQLIKNKLNAALLELGFPILDGIVIPLLIELNALLPETKNSIGELYQEIQKLNGEFTHTDAIRKYFKTLATQIGVYGLGPVGIGNAIQRTAEAAAAQARRGGQLPIPLDPELLILPPAQGLELARKTLQDLAFQADGIGGTVGPWKPPSDDDLERIRQGIALYAKVVVELEKQTKNQRELNTVTKEIPETEEQKLAKFNALIQALSELRDLGVEFAETISDPILSEAVALLDSGVREEAIGIKNWTERVQAAVRAAEDLSKSANLARSKAFQKTDKELDDIDDKIADLDELLSLAANSNDKFSESARKAREDLARQREELSELRDVLLVLGDSIDQFPELSAEELLGLGGDLGQAGLLKMAMDDILALEKRVAEARMAEAFERAVGNLDEAERLLNLINNLEEAAATKALAWRQRLLEAGVDLRVINDVMARFNKTIKKSQEEASKLAQFLGEVVSVTRGILGIADAMGDLDQNTRRAIEGAINLAEALQKIAIGGLSFGSVLQGIGGVVGIVSGLFSSEPDPEEERRRQVIRDNTEAVRRLTNVTAQLTVLRKTGSEDITTFRTAINDYLSSVNDPTKFDDPRLIYTQGRSQLERDLEAAGSSLKELQDFARTFDIELDLDDWSLFIAGMRDLGEIINNLTFDALENTIAGIVEFGNLEADVLDIDDAMERAQLQMALLAEGLVKELFTAANITRASEGDNIIKEALQLISSARAAELPEERAARLEELQRFLLENLIPLFEAGFFGDLSFDAAKALIEALDASTDAYTALADEAAGEISESQNVSAQNKLTVEQGDVLIGLQSTAVEYLRRIDESTAMMKIMMGGGVRPTAVPGERDGVNVEVGGITVEVSGSGDPLLVASVLEDRLVDRIDSKLGEVLLSRVRGTGVAPRRNIP